MGVRGKMKRENLTRNLTFFTVAVLVAAAFLCDSPRNILEGMQKILVSHSLLITDFCTVGGRGAAFLNAAFILLTGVILVMVEKIPFTGPTMYLALFPHSRGEARQAYLHGSFRYLPCAFCDGAVLSAALSSDCAGSYCGGSGDCRRFFPAASFRPYHVHAYGV